MKKLDIKSTLIEGIGIGIKNAGSLILTCLLAIITIWIPYLNIGVIIALYAIPAELSKGHIINPTFIFDKKYRSNMGEFFILLGLEIMAFISAFILFIVPALVLSCAWFLAIYLFVDKGLSAMDALHQSNKLTYGNKWRIFGISIIFVIASIIFAVIISTLFGNLLNMNTLSQILQCVVVLLFFPIQMGCFSVIYRELTKE